MEERAFGALRVVVPRRELEKDPVDHRELRSLAVFMEEYSPKAASGSRTSSTPRSAMR